MPKSRVTSVVKIRLELSNEGEETLDGQSRVCNWLYNQLLDKASQLREQFRQTQDSEVGKALYTERGLRNLIPEIKKEKLFLKVVHSSPLKNAALRASASVQAYQKSRKGKRKGKKTGWPRFRSWGRGWFSLLYDEPNKGFRINGRQLTISLGMGKNRDQRRVYATLESTKGLKDKEVRNLRIVKQLGIFYAVFTVQHLLQETKQVDKAIVLDPNHKNLVYGVGTDNQAIEVAAPSWIKKQDKRIDELISLRDRCERKSHKVTTDNSFFWQPSRRWKKFNHIIERARRKRREQTKTFLFTIAHALFKQYDLVSIGDYTPDGSGNNSTMRRAMNNQSLIGRFKEVLSWVSIKSGKHYHEFCERGTTRTCCRCDHILPTGLDPSIRAWQCPVCNTRHIRDENACQNGIKKLLRDFDIKKLVPGSGPVFIEKRWAWCALPSGVNTTLRGLCSNFVAAPRNLNGSAVASDQNMIVNFAQL